MALVSFKIIIFLALPFINSFSVFIFQNEDEALAKALQMSMEDTASSRQNSSRNQQQNCLISWLHMIISNTVVNSRYYVKFFCILIFFHSLFSHTWHSGVFVLALIKRWFILFLKYLYQIDAIYRVFVVIYIF